MRCTNVLEGIDNDDTDSTTNTHRDVKKICLELVCDSAGVLSDLRSARRDCKNKTIARLDLQSSLPVESFIPNTCLKKEPYSLQPQNLHGLITISPSKNLLYFHRERLCFVEVRLLMDRDSQPPVSLSPFWKGVLRIGVWLWQVIWWVWSSILVGGLLVGSLISLATSGTSGLGDPRTVL